VGRTGRKGLDEYGKNRKHIPTPTTPVTRIFPAGGFSWKNWRGANHKNLPGLAREERYQSQCRHFTHSTGLPFNESKQSMQAIIFDMDGTLADVNPIRHYVSGDKKDFNSFHNASVWVRPNQNILALNHAINDRVAILIVTARNERFRMVTSAWLEKYKVRYDRLYMRKNCDSRADYLVKHTIFNQIIADGYEVVAAVDDNPNVIALWKEKQLVVIEVPGFNG